MENEPVFSSFQARSPMMEHSNLFEFVCATARTFGAVRFYCLCAREDRGNVIQKWDKMAQTRTGTSARGTSFVETWDLPSPSAI
jgi:hypothetical protein